MGAFAFVVAVFGVLAPVACLRYDIAIVLPENDEDATHLTALCFLVSTVGALISVATLAILSHLQVSKEVHTAIPLLLLMLPAGLLLLSFQLVAQSWSLRIHSYQIQSRAIIAQAVVTVGAQIALIPVFGNSAYSLVLGTVAGYLALVLVYLPVIRDAIIPGLKKHFSRADLEQVARNYRRFPILTGPYAFLGQMSVRLVVLALGAFVSARVVGQYAVAQRVIYLPVVTLMAAASQIFYSRAARRLDDPRMPHMVRTVLLAGPVVVGPFFVLMIVFAEPIFATVFGHPWRQAGHFAAILAVPSMVKTLTAWLDRTYDIRGRQVLPLLLEAGYVAVLLVTIYLTLWLTHDADLAVMVYSAVTVVFYLVWMVCALSVAGIPARLGVQFMVVTTVVIGLMLGADSLINWLNVSVALRIACALLLAAILSMAGVRYGLRRMRTMEQSAR